MSRFYEIEMRGKQWMHRVPDIDLYNHAGASEEGRVVYSESDGKLYVGSTVEWVLVTSSTDIFPSATKVLMGKFPLPTGWNIDVTIDDAYAVRMTITEANTGNTSGSWTISGISSEGQHKHSMTISSNNVYLGKSDVSGFAAQSNHRHSMSNAGDHTHFHDGTWRFPRLFYCVAEKT
ncbi:MAG: hypothetical protein ACW99Q_14995 [Candidatus Kariarchaeaceae archaeon]|jgi:hypothetical protein